MMQGSDTVWGTSDVRFPNIFYHATCVIHQV